MRPHSLLKILFGVGLTAILALIPADNPLPAPHSFPGTISPRLVRAMAAGESGPVWVFFTDKGLAGADLDAALRQAESDLHPRAARRRAKVFPAGGPLVDAADLPLRSSYVERILATGAVLRQESRWLNAASFRATPGQIMAMAGLDGVDRIDLVNRFTPAAVPTPVHAPEPVAAAGPKSTTAIDYGSNFAAMMQANVIPLHDQGFTGAGVVVGMLDTGFRTTHEALAHIPVLDAWDFVNDDGVVDNELGDPASARNHGTMTLSTVAGHSPGQLVAPAFGVSVILAKTEDVAEEVPQEEDFWVAGMEYAEGLGAHIISSSLGYIDWYVYDDLDGNTAVTTIAADLAVGRGLVVITSAGNDRLGTGSLLVPADGDSVIAVGAVGADDLVTYFSSPGPTADGRIKPDVAALGSGNTVSDPNLDTGYLGVSGTSFSCPLTAGVVALMLERLPELTPMQILEALKATASQNQSPDNYVGWGIINAAAAAAWFGPSFVHQPVYHTEDTVGPYLVTSVITDRVGVDQGSLEIIWRVDGGSWNVVPMTATGSADTFAGNIPGQGEGTTVEYYLQATGTNGFTTHLPGLGDAAPYRFEVGTWLNISYGAVPGASIPDGPGWGATSIITVPVAESGDMLSVGVDINVTHPDIGELAVILTAPDGTQVTLHDHSQVGVSNLIGNYSATLAADGPGALEDFLLGTNKGDWSLQVVDNVPGNAGTLVSWGLDFTLVNYVSPVAADRTPRRNLLEANAPNPFNPRTRISFALARGGNTRLSIFDLRGMLIRNLIDTDLPAGPQAVFWDGRDAAGLDVGSGTYFYRLENGGDILARKMLLLR